MNGLNSLLMSLPGKNEAWTSMLGFVLLGIATKVNTLVLAPKGWAFDDAWIQSAVALLTYWAVQQIANIREENLHKGTNNAGV